MDSRYNIYDLILPLDGYLNDAYDLSWAEWNNMWDIAVKLIPTGLKPQERNAMRNFYNMFLLGDEKIYSLRKREALDFVAKVAHIDNAFIGLVAEMDMVKLTNTWIGCNSINNYMFLLGKLTEIGYETDWDRMYDDVNTKILELEVCGDNIGGEFYCILHGFLMIMTASQNYLERQSRFELFSKHWRFLCHLYSVMVRRIIGMGFPNYAGVANNAKHSTDCVPYLKLLYSALIERHDELCQLGTKKKSLDNAILKISEVMSNHEQSDDLDELCEVLFPEEIREMLNTHRLPTYKQLRVENQMLREQQRALRIQIQEQTRQTNEQIAKLTEMLKSGVEAAIPVKYIEQELMELPPETAWGVFKTLNELLEANETWREYDIGIRNKLKERLKLSEKPTTQNIIYPQAGSTANIGCEMKQPEFKMIEAKQ